VATQLSEVFGTPSPSVSSSGVSGVHAVPQPLVASHAL
jgi:hypothetical protein